MTGYEKSPDYGGSEVTKREIAVWIAVAIIAAALIDYWLFF
jgi:hypothetical protein